MDLKKPAIEDISFEEVSDKQKEPQFNPQANYAWDVSDQFTIDGKTMDILFNYLQGKVNTQEVQEALILFDAFQRLQKVFVESVAFGVIKEVPKAESTN